MKLRLAIIMMLIMSFLVACGGNDDANKNEENNQNEKNNDNKEPEAVTSASIVDSADAFTNAVSENGTWIIAILKDLNIEGEVTVAGEFHDKNEPGNDIYRKLALYSQDKDFNITDQYTLTVPRLIVKSENFKIQGGTVKGDVYVEANGFNLDSTANIEGNLYYANEDVEKSAVIDGQVSGVTQISNQ